MNILELNQTDAATEKQSADESAFEQPSPCSVVYSIQLNITWFPDQAGYRLTLRVINRKKNARCYLVGEQVRKSVAGVKHFRAWLILGLLMIPYSHRHPTWTTSRLGCLSSYPDSSCSMMLSHGRVFDVGSRQSLGIHISLAIDIAHIRQSSTMFLPVRFKLHPHSSWLAFRRWRHRNSKLFYSRLSAIA